jgi:hypothetical protein
VAQGLREQDRSPPVPLLTSPGSVQLCFFPTVLYIRFAQYGCLNDTVIMNMVL